MKFMIFISQQGKFYAKVRNIDQNNPRKRFFAHRIVLNEFDITLTIDHKDGNGLNNQKSNLRYCTRSQNSMNRSHTCLNTIGFKGVWKNSKNRYSATLRVNGISHYGGLFKTPFEAAYKYNEMAIQYHGDFAYLNPVTSTKYKDGTMYVHEKRTGDIVERIHHFTPI